ncbi:MAG: hypothetical protein EB830_03385 [Nitrosopumilus sp. H13]|nr:MAG: hypothetical protein EB830_03385 [Nitrosopumilus sp. H13]
MVLLQIRLDEKSLSIFFRQVAIFLIKRIWRRFMFLILSGFHYIYSIAGDWDAHRRRRICLRPSSLFTLPVNFL